MNRWAWAGAAALLLFLALLAWVVARRGHALPLESRSLEFVAAHRTDFQVAASKAFHVAGHFYLVVAYAAAAAFYLWARKRKREAIAVVASILALAGAVNVAKQAVARARPDPARQVIHDSGGSYPSGHASGTMALALWLTTLARRRKLRVLVGTIAIPAAVAAGLSRLCLGVHFPSDVLGGWLVGAAAFCASGYFSYAPMSTTPPCGRETPSKS